jgi:biopolymer transport protein ExbD
MSSDSIFSQSLLDDDQPLLARRDKRDEATFDITAMIDLVFMMNIFFLVTTIGATLAEVDLPAVRHCVAADPATSVAITMVESDDGSSCLVYVGDGAEGRPLSDPEEQEDAVRAAVQEGVRKNFDTVLIKAERNVRLRDVRRISTASAAEKMTLKLAVIEKE